MVSLHPKIMGIDVGLKNIATCSVGTKNLIFKGNVFPLKKESSLPKEKNMANLKSYQPLKSLKKILDG